jgi:transcriptional regulator with XRE-family HTH domain
MLIGGRLRGLREQRDLSQGDIERKTGLLRCYVSRVENGHTVPAIETLEKLARAMEIPMYRLFCGQQEPAKPPSLLAREVSGDSAWENSKEGQRMLTKFRRLLSRTGPRHQKLLLLLAQRMAGSSRAKR